MASIDKQGIQRTLEKIKARKAAHARSQASKAIEGVSPELIQAVRNLDEISAQQKSQKDFMVMAKEYQAQHKCRLIDAMMVISRQHPEAHEEYIRKANAEQ